MIEVDAFELFGNIHFRQLAILVILLNFHGHDPAFVGSVGSRILCIERVDILAS